MHILGDLSQVILQHTKLGPWHPSRVRPGASPALWLAITCMLQGAIFPPKAAETYVDNTEQILAMEQGVLPKQGHH